MRYLFVLLLLGVINARTFCRPLHSDNADEESEVYEAEYEGDGAGSDDAIEDDDSQVAQEESSVDEQEEDSEPVTRMRLSNRNTYLQRVAADTPSRANDNLSSFGPSKKIEDEAINGAKEIIEDQSPSGTPDDSTRFIAKNLVSQQFSNSDDGLKYVREEKIPIHKQTSQTVSDEEGDVLFEPKEHIQSRWGRTNKNDDKPEDNSLQEDVSVKHTKLNIDGDRRSARDIKHAIQEVSPSVTNVPTDISAGTGAAASSAASSSVTDDMSSAIFANEDEEAAIKRHIKKLTADELKELLNSLSEDKRNLLKKIMDSDNELSNDVKKREITKKAGAAPDENSYLEGGQSDSSKLQEGCIVSEANLQSPSSEVTDVVNKQDNAQPSDITFLPVTTKPSDLGMTNVTTIMSLIPDKKLDTKVVDKNNQAEVKLTNSGPDHSKTIKREASFNDLSGIKSSFDTDDNRFADFNGYGYFCPRDKDVLDYDNSQSELNKNGNTLKRDTSEKESDAPDTIKALEESFPNSNFYNENDLNDENAPLVRVKRRNIDNSVKKRSPNVLPENKVGYLPYEAENNDEDNEEGNEFDDEGFYNPPCNLVKSDIRNTISEDPSPSDLEDVSGKQLYNANSEPNNMESRSASLGSDTDSVLSGGDSIDENLMFNSASRNKRTIDIDTNSNVEKSNDDNTIAKLNHSLSLEDETKSATDNYGDDQNFHVKDVMNPLQNHCSGGNSI